MHTVVDVLKFVIYIEKCFYFFLFYFWFFVFQGANLELKNIVKANMQFQGHLVFYLTLKTLGGGETIFYEAKVYQDMGFIYEVTIFSWAIHYKVNGNSIFYPNIHM